MAVSKTTKYRYGKWMYSEEELQQQYKEATRRGREADAREPRAKSVAYDAKTRRLVIELRNGAVFLLPVYLLEGLADATNKQLSTITLMPGGSALHSDELDVDYSIPGLVAGVFGSKSWMSELGRKGGEIRSRAKAEAARTNGARGGRPRRRLA